MTAVRQAHDVDLNKVINHGFKRESVRSACARINLDFGMNQRLLFCEEN